MDVTQLVSQALAYAYGVQAVGVRRLHAGLVTTNLEVTAAGGGRLFVKVYRPGADLAAARAAIELTRYANAGGVPTAVPVCDAGGATVHVGPRVGLSVWTFVDGDVGDTVALSAARMNSLGEVVGRLHDRLVGFQLPDGHRPTWCDLDRVRGAITTMIDRLWRASHLDEATRMWGAQVLRWRLTRLPQVAEIFAGLPEPAMQVVHGDLSPGNPFFRGEQVAALVDFSAPQVRPVLWEVARLACSQFVVLEGGHWVERLGCLLRAYQGRNGSMPAEVLAAVPAVARCFMTAPVTPFDDLTDPQAAVAAADDPASVPALTRYAMARHETVLRLWEYSASDDRTLRQALGCGAPG